MSPFARVLAVAAVAVAALAAGDAKAQSAPAVVGWMPLVDVRVGDHCSRGGCVAELPIGWRSTTYAIASDAALGVTLTGRLDFVCADGGQRMALLPSPPAGGIALVSNPCPNGAVKRARVVVESASVPGAGRDGATLRVLGSMV